MHILLILKFVLICGCSVNSCYFIGLHTSISRGNMVACIHKFLPLYCLLHPFSWSRCIFQNILLSISICILPSLLIISLRYFIISHSNDLLYLMITYFYMTFPICHVSYSSSHFLPLLLSDLVIIHTLLSGTSAASTI